MAVGAHHDDNDFIAGTLMRHRQAGWRVVSVVMTDGTYGASGASADNIPIREGESLAAAKLLGAECVFLHFTEGNFWPTEASRMALLRAIRRHAPDVLITHPQHDCHPDHMNTSLCVRQTLGAVWNPCVEPELPPCGSPKLYYCDAWFVPFEPDQYVDVSDLVDLKTRALQCHKTQLPADAADPHGMIEMGKARNRMRGIEAGVEYAEAFRLVPNLGSVRLTKVLG
jgi:LmbE family N-acetylglucosaminyl deacetylase